MIVKCVRESLFHSMQLIMKSDHFDGTVAFKSRLKKLLVVIDGGSFLLWMWKRGERGRVAEKVSHD